MRIRVASGIAEFTVQDLAAASNVVTLAINALPGASPKRYACVRADDNGVKGINKSREDYFYHSVLLGKKEGKPDHHICPCDDEGEG